MSRIVDKSTINCYSTATYIAKKKINHNNFFKKIVVFKKINDVINTVIFKKKFPTSMLLRHGLTRLTYTQKKKYTMIYMRYWDELHNAASIFVDRIEFVDRSWGSVRNFFYVLFVWDWTYFVKNIEICNFIKKTSHEK